MPTTLTPIAPAIAGVVVAATAAAATMQVANPKGNVLLRVSNGSGGALNVTVSAGATPNRPADGTYPLMVLGNNVVAIANGVIKIIGPLPKAYNDALGFVQLAFDVTATVTVEPIQI